MDSWQALSRRVLNRTLVYQITTERKPLLETISKALLEGKPTIQLNRALGLPDSFRTCHMFTVAVAICTAPCKIAICKAPRMRDYLAWQYLEPRNEKTKYRLTGDYYILNSETILNVTVV